MTGYEFNDNEITQLKTIFEMMAEGQSSISTATLRSIFTKAQINMTEEQWTEQKGRMNDPIRFDDFLAVIERQRQINPEEGLMKVFSILDKDNKGLINAEDLRQGLLGFGDTVTEDDVRRMIQSADVDGDGMINYEEFVKILTPSRVNGQK